MLIYPTSRYISDISKFYSTFINVCQRFFVVARVIIDGTPISVAPCHSYPLSNCIAIVIVIVIVIVISSECYLLWLFLLFLAKETHRRFPALGKSRKARILLLFLALETQQFWKRLHRYTTLLVISIQTLPAGLMVFLCYQWLTFSTIREGDLQVWKQDRRLRMARAKNATESNDKNFFFIFD